MAGKSRCCSPAWPTWGQGQERIIRRCYSVELLPIFDVTGDHRPIKPIRFVVSRTTEIEIAVANCLKIDRGEGDIISFDGYCAAYADNDEICNKREDQRSKIKKNQKIVLCKNSNQNNCNRRNK